MSDIHPPSWLTDPEALSERVAGIAPALQSMWNEHLRENAGEPLPHLYLGEVAGWFVEPLETGRALDASRRALCGLLEDALTRGDDGVRELVRVSFIENLDPAASEWFLPCFGRALTADFLRHAGST